MEEIKSWKIPLTVRNILKRKKLNSQNDYNYNQNQQKILNATVQSLKAPNINVNNTKISQPTVQESRSRRPSRDIQAKVINTGQEQRQNETSSTLITKATGSSNIATLSTETTDSVMVQNVDIPIAIEKNLDNLHHNSRHKMRRDTVKRLLQLLKHCENENYANSMRLF